MICDRCENKSLCKIFHAVKDFLQEISIGHCIYRKEQSSKVQIDPSAVLNRASKIKGLMKTAGEPKISGITVE